MLRIRLLLLISLRKRGHRQRLVAFVMAPELEWEWDGCDQHVISC